MSRYTSAEWLKEEIRKAFPSFYTRVQINALVNLAPSVEITRCGECKYWKSTVQMPNGTEVKCLYGRKPDDFCSYGEREGE